jgi:hypothetical protein
VTVSDIVAVSVSSAVSVSVCVRRSSEKLAVRVRVDVRGTVHEPDTSFDAVR